MANVDLDDINEGLGNSGEGQRRFITALGPMKLEWNIFRVGTSDDFINDDTFNTRLAHPLAATGFSANNDLTGTAFIGSVSLDVDETSSTFKRVTLRDITTATDTIVVLVVGF